MSTKTYISCVLSGYLSNSLIVFAFLALSISPAMAKNTTLIATQTSNTLDCLVPILVTAQLLPGTFSDGYYIRLDISGGDASINAFGAYSVSANVSVYSGNLVTSGGAPIVVILSNPNGTPFQLDQLVTIDVSDASCQTSVTMAIPSYPNVGPNTAVFTGVVFYDANQNGLLDVGETTLSNQIINGSYGPPEFTALLYSHTNNNGQYTFYATQEGSYQIGFTPPIGWQVSTPTQYVLNAQSGGGIANNNFGVYPTSITSNGNLLITSTPVRCDWQTAYYIDYANTGSTSANGVVSFTPNVLTNYNYTNIPTDSIGADGTLYWHFSNLAPYNHFLVRVVCQMPDATYMGDTLAVAANATVSIIGSTETNAYNYIYQPILTCSYDPNDKQVTPAGIGVAHHTLMNEALTYTIRFQNTGNDTAFRVVVLDTLDANVDASSFELITSSHAVSTMRYGNNLVKFTFNNINLPDSSTNQAESNGYIIYRLRAKPDLANHTPINNTAYIYFDQNEAIVTNTTLNTMVYELPNNNPLSINLGLLVGTISAKGNIIDWQTFSEQNNDYFLIQRATISGSFLTIGKVDGADNSNQSINYRFIDANPTNGYNYYRLAWVDYNGNTKYSNTVALDNTVSALFSLSPNPANRYLYINNKSEQTTLYRIYNLLGLELATGSFNAATQRIDVANLAKGIYFISLQQNTQIQTLQWLKD